MTFKINGSEYTIEPCTTICAADAEDESKRQEALCVTNECNGELFKYVVFGYDMPETTEQFADICADPGAWESSQEVLGTAIPGRKKKQTAMKQISIDNGATYVTPAEALEVVSIDTIAEYMDNDTRETVHNELAPCSDVEFLTRYLEIAPDDLIIG